MGFHVYDIFWVKYLFWKHQQHVSNFLIFHHFLVLAIVENPQLLNSSIWQLHKQFTSGRMECIALSVLINSYNISLAFIALALMICWAHEKPRNNHKKKKKKIAWKEPEHWSRTYTTSSSGKPWLALSSQIFRDGDNSNPLGKPLLCCAPSPGKFSS